MEGPIKVLMTADTIGGVWTYAIDLCKGLQKYDIAVHLLTMGKLPDGQQRKQVQELSNVTLYESDYKLEWMPDCWDDVAKAKQWVQSIYEKVKPDVLHFNNYGQTTGTWDCPVITVYHSCVQTWWKAVKGENAPQEWDQYKALVNKALAGSNMVVAPSASILEQAKHIYGTLRHVKVIYNGSQNKGYNQYTKQPFILTAGRLWDEAKNIQLLTRIGATLSWPVYIAGDNTDIDTTIKIPGNVQFTGQLTPHEMQQYMKKASVFVMPAKYEPFGLAILEAANAGCALALSNIDTLQEIWGETAAYFNPSDENEAHSVVEQLINDAEWRNAMALKSEKRAKEFSVENMAYNYNGLYQELLQQIATEPTNQYL
jgi:glycosyltransferase involved in cell wall biosynthesis